jgi:hypothetical protein
MAIPRNAPILTRQRRGSVACRECGRTFATTPGLGPIVEDEQNEPVRNRYGGFSDNRTARVTVRYHESCLAQVQRFIEEQRARSERDRAETIARLRAQIDGCPSATATDEER